MATLSTTYSNMTMTVTYSVSSADATTTFSASRVDWNFYNIDTSNPRYKCQVYIDGTKIYDIPETTILTKTKSWNRTTSNQSKTLKIDFYDTSSKKVVATNSTTISVPKLASYTVTYNANGGSGAPGSQTKWYNVDLTLSSGKPTRTNYVFKNWNTKADGTGTAYASGASYKTNAKVTLYAQWYAPYTVTYNANGGSGAPGSQIKIYNTNLTLSSGKPTRTNYVFKNWNTKADGTGTSYEPGSTYSTNAELTLYAQWYAPYTVTYNANGGSGVVNDQVKIYNSALTLRSNSFIRVEHVYIDDELVDMKYQFTEWNTSADGSGDSYPENEAYTKNEDVTLYAMWKQLPVIKSNCYRINSQGDPDDTGSDLKIFVKWITDQDQEEPTYGKWIFVTVNEYTQMISLDQYLNRYTSGTVNSSMTGIELRPDQNYEIDVRVVDSDNRQNTITQQLTTNYSMPVITTVSADRCDSQGNITDNGTYAKITAEWTVANIGSQTKPVSLSAIAKYQQTVVTETSTTDFSGTVSGDIVYGTTSLILGTGSTFDTEGVYDIEVILNDVVNSFSVYTTIQVAYFPFDILSGGHGAAFGKPSQTAELLDVGYKINTDAGYKLNNENCYPIIVRNTWSTSSDTTTLPLKPCFIFSLSDNYIYYCNASGTIVKVN